MEQLTRAFSVMVRWLARGLPYERQQWVQALQAEADVVPAGRQRLRWLIGGLWLVIREGHMARKAFYWLGATAVAAAAAWAIWLSWRTATSADAEATTDRVRILVGATALLGLPWLGRRQGWFGPVSNGITARIVRLAGAAAICAAGIELVRFDSEAGTNGIGYGRFSWLQELAGIACIGAAVAGPRLVRNWWPKMEPNSRAVVPVVAGACAFLVVPIQTLFVGYVAAVLAATARRSPVSTAALAAGTSLGLAAGGIMYELAVALDGNSDRYTWLLMLVILPATSLLMAAFSGVAATWRVTGVGNPEELRQALVRQGAWAGVIAGAVAGLLLELTFVGFGVMMCAGPLLGAAGGASGAAIMADRRRHRRSDGLKAAGLFVADS